MQHRKPPRADSYRGFLAARSARAAAPSKLALAEPDKRPAIIVLDPNQARWVVTSPRSDEARSHWLSSVAFHSDLSGGIESHPVMCVATSDTGLDAISRSSRPPRRAPSSSAASSSRARRASSSPPAVADRRHFTLTTLPESLLWCVLRFATALPHGAIARSSWQSANRRLYLVWRSDRFWDRLVRGTRAALAQDVIGPLLSRPPKRVLRPPPFPPPTAFSYVKSSGDVVPLCVVATRDGFGLYTPYPIAAGRFVGEYAGALRERERGPPGAAAQFYGPDFTVFVDHLARPATRMRYFELDAREAGNVLRFIRHSAEPEQANVAPTVEVDDEDDDDSELTAPAAPRLWLRARRAIPAWEELKWDKFHLLSGRRTRAAAAAESEETKARVTRPATADLLQLVSTARDLHEAGRHGTHVLFAS